MSAEPPHWVVEPDGWPTATDQKNAMLENGSTALAYIQGIRRLHLKNLESAFADGHMRAFAMAVRYCHANRLAAPSWVAEAAERLVHSIATGRKKGRGGRPDDRLHAERWIRVIFTRGTNEIGTEEAIEEVAKLEGGVHKEASVRRSYYRVERARRRGDGARYDIASGYWDNVM